jgi:hypothetical protein
MKVVVADIDGQTRLYHEYSYHDNPGLVTLIREDGTITTGVSVSDWKDLPFRHYRAILMADLCTDLISGWSLTEGTVYQVKWHHDGLGFTAVITLEERLNGHLHLLVLQVDHPTFKGPLTVSQLVERESTWLSPLVHRTLTSIAYARKAY